MIESNHRYPGAPDRMAPQWYTDRLKAGDVFRMEADGSSDRFYINGVEQFERSDDDTYLRSRTRICPLWVKASVIAAALALLGWVVLRSWGLV